jgi:prolipoprotein diacylglyceryltransferase
MQVVLFETEHFVVLAYPAMILLAIAAGLGTLACRGRKRPVDHAAVAGWLGGRLAMGLHKHGLQGISLRHFLPTEHVPQSFSVFSAVALPVLLLALWRRHIASLAHLDLLAPSAFAALAIAKIGCLLAGCCAGAECPADRGIRYPYGSLPYAMQTARSTIHPPDALVRTEDNGATSLFGHIDFLRAVRRAPPEELTRQAAHYALTYDQWVQLARNQRSNPVWPVPLFYTIAAGILWLIAEAVYRSNTRPGSTLALVLLTYAAMRFSFDRLLAQSGTPILGLPMAQLVALVPLIAGASIAILGMRKKTHA